MSSNVSRDDIVTEMREVERDLQAFKIARDTIQNRIVELEGTERYERFAGWAATQAIMNVLILAMVKCEGLLEDYRTELEKRDVAPVIRLIKETTE